MSTPVVVTVGVNECGDIGFALIKSNIEAAVGALDMDINLTVDAVVFTRMTGAVLPAAHADDAKKLEAIEEFARQLRGHPVVGAATLGGQMIGSHLLAILRGEV